MISSDGFWKFPPEFRDLSLLEELERDPEISQRMLAHKIGVALGVINSSLRTMGAKGWIRTAGFDHRRQRHLLTPEGAAEKTRLSAHLASWRLQHYGALKEMITGTLCDMENKGVERVVFYGVSAEMEVTYIALQQRNLKLVGIVEDDDQWKSRIILGYELEPVSRVLALKPDCILITSFAETEKKRQYLAPLIGKHPVSIRELSLFTTPTG
jgi:DNA-binding MarR family transcriptional regulator